MKEISTILAGRDFLAKADYPAAIETIGKFNEFFPDSPKSNDMAVLGIDTYLAWANDLRGKDEFESSLKQLDLALKDFASSNPERITEINNAIASNYLQWGQNLAGKKDYIQAIQMFETVTNQYSQSESSAQAFKVGAQAHYDLALQLLNTNNFELAVDHLNTILNVYQTSEIKPKAVETMPQALLGWGKNLNDNNSLLLAIEKFGEVANFTLNEKILAEADNETQTSIGLLAKDTGSDGSSVLNDAEVQACSGEVPTHQSVGILTEEQGKAAVCGPILLPYDLIADAPGTFRYVIFREDDSKRIQACPYTGGHTLERWVNTSLISVKLVKDGSVFSKKTFSGAPPSNCPYEYSFYGDTDQSWGDIVSDDDISTWLAKVLK